MGKLNSKESPSMRINILESIVLGNCKNSDMIYNMLNADINNSQAESSQLYVKEFVKYRMEDLERDNNEPDPEKKKKRLDIALKKCFLSMIFMSYASDPILWKESQNPVKKNILIFGNIGNGKSTILNKLAYMMDPNEKEFQQYFLAA